MKKLIAVLVAVMLIFTTVVVSAAPSYGVELSNMPERVYSQKFKDVSKNHWAFEYIGELATRGIFSGYPDGNFRPDNGISRAEFAKIMVVASGLNVTPVEHTIFEDVLVNDWCAPYIECAKPFLNGYVLNNKNFYFPYTMALREDIAVALVKLKGYDVWII